MSFLGRVSRELAARRPWPAPRFAKVDVAEWPTFGAATPIARVHRPAHQLTGAVGYPFEHVGRLPVLILRLGSGEVIALLGSVDPGSTSVTCSSATPASRPRSGRTFAI